MSTPSSPPEPSQLHPGAAGPCEPRPVQDDVTVLIPTLGRPMLRDTLRSIVCGDSWPARVIVVDQSSSQEIAALLEAVRSDGVEAEHVPSSQKGVAAARNRGIERVRTRFFAITDDDCLVRADWLDRMMTELRRDPDAIVTGRVEPGGEGYAVSIITDRERVAYAGRRHGRDVLYAGNMGCSRSIYNRIGGFDESAFLRNAEDNDWCYRALRLGIQIVYAPNVVVTHRDWRDEDQLLVTYRAYAQSQGGFYGKHLRRGDVFIVRRAAYTLIRSAVRWCLGLLQGDRVQRASGRIWLTRLLPGMIAGWRGENKRIAGRSAGE